MYGKTMKRDGEEKKEGFRVIGILTILGAVGVMIGVIMFFVGLFEANGGIVIVGTGILALGLLFSFGAVDLEREIVVNSNQIHVAYDTVQEVTTKTIIFSDREFAFYEDEGQVNYIYRIDHKEFKKGDFVRYEYIDGLHGNYLIKIEVEEKKE